MGPDTSEQFFDCDDYSVSFRDNRRDCGEVCAAIDAPSGSAVECPAGPPFELLSSMVVDGLTREQLAPDAPVLRGSSRLETLSFRVGQPLAELQRQTVTAKSYGITWANVGVDQTAMGTYGLGEHKFELPMQKVPEDFLAKGMYKVCI